MLDMVSEAETTTDVQAPSAAEDMAVEEPQPCDTGVAEEDAAAIGEGEVAAAAEKQEDMSGPVSVGPKSFASSVEMFDYFYNFLHRWNPNIDVNKYEHLLLLELIKKGHPDPEKKIGVGVQAFQIRYHPEYKSRCFFIVRTDQSVEDFSFRKCVDRILPLPENMKSMGGDQSGYRGRGRGRGRGGHYRR